MNENGSNFREKEKQSWTDVRSDFFVSYTKESY